MTTESTTTSGCDDWKDCRPRPDDDACDPSSIDELKCRASGVAAQAAYNATYQPDLVAAQKDYDTARKAYREARHDAAGSVRDMKHEVKHLLHRIRCLIEQDRVIRCLDEAYCTVEEQLDCCEGPVEGCCVDDDRDYNTDPPVKLCKLIRRIARYQRRVDKAKECFGSLTKEPENLKTRVAGASAAITQVKDKLDKEDPAKVDLKRLYAETKIVGRTLDRIWNGFDDTNEFVDCLCRALTSWSRGAEAVSLLTGAKAIQECHRDSAKQWCDNLIANPVDEILVGYDKLCPSPKPCKPAEHDDCEEDADEDDCEDDHEDEPSNDDGCRKETGGNDSPQQGGDAPS